MIAASGCGCIGATIGTLSIVLATAIRSNAASVLAATMPVSSSLFETMVSIGVRAFGNQPAARLRAFPRGPVVRRRHRAERAGRNPMLAAILSTTCGEPHSVRPERLIRDGGASPIPVAIARFSRVFAILFPSRPDARAAARPRVRSRARRRTAKRAPALFGQYAPTARLGRSEMPVAIGPTTL